MTTSPDLAPQPPTTVDGNDDTVAPAADPSAGGPDPIAARPPSAPGPSLKPALVVIACVLVVSFGGFALALLGGQPSSDGATYAGFGKPVPGVSLRAIPAAGVIRHIATPGAPPIDVIRSVVVPSGVTVTGTANHDRSAGQFDRAVLMTVNATHQELVSFFKTELKRGRWSLLGNYPLAQGGTELLAQRAGSDGWEWEIGLLLNATSPSISPALAGGDQSAPTGTIQLRLFQIGDGN